MEMAFKAVLASVLTSAVLVGCGGGAGSSNSEYSLSDYEGRDVNLDSYAGTWVAVGSGSYLYTYDDFKDDESLVIKEYFVVTGSSETGYKKSSCDGDFTESVFVTGSAVRFGFFEGSITENGVISGVYLDDSSSTDEVDKTELNLTMIKISDSVERIGTVTANKGNGDITTRDITCYQQMKGKGVYGDSEGGNTSYTSEYYYSNVASIFSYTDADKNIELDFYDAGIYLDTFLGDDVSFNVVRRSNLSEEVGFSGSDESITVVGNIDIQLPAQ